MCRRLVLRRVALPGWLALVIGATGPFIALAQTQTQTQTPPPTRAETRPQAPEAVPALGPDGAALRRQALVLSLPAGRSRLTPFLGPQGEALLHIVPEQAAEGEQLLDLRSGQPWAGDSAEVLARFRRLPLDREPEVAAAAAMPPRAAGASSPTPATTAPATPTPTPAAAEARLQQALGCQAPVQLCSSPADGEQVLLLQPLPDRQLRVQLLDLRPLLQGMEALMAGQRGHAEVTRLDLEWDLLRLASDDPARRARWLQQLRGIDEPARWQRLRDAAVQGPRLLRWPRLQGDDDPARAIDLAAELELLGLRMNLALAAQAALARPGDPEARRGVAEALLLGSAVGFRSDVPSHLVDELLRLEPAARGRLAQALDAEARQRRHHGLWCYAEWVSARACAGTPPWAGAAPGGAAAGGAGAAPAGPPAPPTPPAGTTAGAASPRPDTAATRPPALPRPGAAGSAATAVATAPATNPAPTPAATPATNPAPASNASRPATPPAAPTATPPEPPARAGDAQQEWVVLAGLPNHRPLLSYQEATGVMVPDAGAIGGLSFVARSLGPARDGRFELAVVPSGGARPRVVHGRYRVLVKLVLDYTREDSCVGTLRCLFASNERFARTDRREVVFLLNPANRHSGRQEARFGSLVPLEASGADRYRSTLKEARLAVEGVRFQLQ